MNMFTFVLAVALTVGGSSFAQEAEESVASNTVVGSSAENDVVQQPE